MVDRFNPPVVNDEAETPDYMQMSQAVHGGFVLYSEYEEKSQEIELLRANARRMMEAVKNSCADIVEQKKEEPGEDGVLDTLESLERAIRAIDVDFELFKPRA